MESIDKISADVTPAPATTNPDSELVTELLGKVAELQAAIVEVVELVSKIQVAETKEEPDPEPDPEPTE